MLRGLYDGYAVRRVSGVHLHALAGVSSLKTKSSARPARAALRLQAILLEEEADRRTKVAVMVPHLEVPRLEEAEEGLGGPAVGPPAIEVGARPGNATGFPLRLG